MFVCKRMGIAPRYLSFCVVKDDLSESERTPLVGAAERCCFSIVLVVICK